MAVFIHAKTGTSNQPAAIEKLRKGKRTRTKKMKIFINQEAASTPNHEAEAKVKRKRKGGGGTLCLYHVRILRPTGEWFYVQ